MLTLLAKILSALNSESEPKQIAWAAAFALVAGFNSTFSLLAVVSYMMICFLRVNLAIFFATFVLFSGLSVLLAPVFHLLGDALLNNEGLTSFWTGLYQGYWLRIFEYNNTKVLGGAVMSVILFVPMVALGQFIVIHYRHSIMAFINKFKIVQSLKASKFYRIYEAVGQE